MRLHHNSSVNCVGFVFKTLRLDDTINTSANYVNIGSDNGLSPERRQDIILTNADLLSIWFLGKNQILIKYKNFHWRKYV